MVIENVCDMCGREFTQTVVKVWKLGKFHKLVCDQCDQWMSDGNEVPLSELENV